MIQNIILATAFISLVESKVEGRIVGGQRGDANQFKHLVRIIANNQVCGGCLIAKNAVLTAAHCARNPNPAAYDIKEGKTTQQEMNSPNAARLVATSVHAHQGYNPHTLEADITVILVNPNHNMNTFLSIDKTGISREGTPLHLAGWGKEHAQGSVSPHLKTLDLYVVSNEICQLNYKIFNPTTHICADSKRQGHTGCMGDSGSPLVANGRTVVGVVSYGSQKCNIQGSSFSRVSTYAKWIQGIMNSEGSQKERPPQQNPSSPQYPQYNPNQNQQRQDQRYPQEIPSYPNFQYPGFNQEPSYNHPDQYQLFYQQPQQFYQYPGY